MKHSRSAIHTPLADPKTTAPRRSCYALARRRALRARREGRHGLVVFLIFVWALFSAPFVQPPIAALPMPNPPRPQGQCSRSGPTLGLGQSDDVDVPAPRPPYAVTGRYKTRPSLVKLMADLRRGAARKDATAELLPRIRDAATREWVAARIAELDITALAIHVRQGRPEETTFAAWQAEANNRGQSETSGYAMAVQPGFTSKF